MCESRVRLTITTIKYFGNWYAQAWVSDWKMLNKLPNLCCRKVKVVEHFIRINPHFRTFGSSNIRTFFARPATSIFCEENWKQRKRNWSLGRWDWMQSRTFPLKRCSSKGSASCCVCYWAKEASSWLERGRGAGGGKKGRRGTTPPPPNQNRKERAQKLHFFSLSSFSGRDNNFNLFFFRTHSLTHTHAHASSLAIHLSLFLSHSLSE